MFAVGVRCECSLWVFAVGVRSVGVRCGCSLWVFAVGVAILSKRYDAGILAGLVRTVQYDFEKVEGALVDADSLPR